MRLWTGSCAGSSGLCREDAGLSFSLLAPLALALGVLVAGPILAHMARQKPSRKQEYGAMLLLKRLVKRLEKRRRIRDRVLLLLRALAVLLLVLAAGRPRLTWPGDAPEFGGTGAVVLVVDTSMSMAWRKGGSTLAAKARERAESLLDDLPGGTLVGLVSAGSPATRITPELTDDHERVRAALRALQAGYGDTDLHGALLESRRLLGGEVGEVLVYTDEAGPGTVAAASSELRMLVERGSAVIPMPVRPAEISNLTPLSGVYGDGLEGGSITVQLASYGEDAVEVPVTVTLPDGDEITAFGALEEAGVTELRFTVPQTVPGGVAEARVHDENLDLDDRRYFHLPRVGASRVLVVDGDPGVTPIRSEVYFLERALAPWAGQRAGVVPEVVSPAGLRRLDPEVHQVVFLCNVADPGPWAASLVDFVRGGGSLFISLGENVTPARMNGPLRDILPAPLRRATPLVAMDVDGRMPLAAPDTEHPLFRPFNRQGRMGFTRMGAARAFTLEPYQEGDGTDERPVTLLRFQDGNPALVERRAGSGRVLLWTSTIDMDWKSNAPAQATYMPFIQRVVGYLGGAAGGGALRSDAVVGERVVVELPMADLEPSLWNPDGAPVQAELVRGELLEIGFVPDRPGAWTIGIEGEPPLAQVAVNTPVGESDLRVYDTLAEAEAAVDPKLLENSMDLGRASLGLGVLALLLQALLATRSRV